MVTVLDALDNLELAIQHLSKNLELLHVKLQPVLDQRDGPKGPPNAQTLGESACPVAGRLQGQVYTINTLAAAVSEIAARLGLQQEPTSVPVPMATTYGNAAETSSFRRGY